MPGNSSKQRKGIVLAGGSGTRLWPMTAVVSKQLLSVWDKPMIYYPLSVLMLAGIREVLLISTPADLPRFQELLGDGSHFGISLKYEVQIEPNGLAEALLIAESSLDGSPSTLILGDNIFYGHGLTDCLAAANASPGATIFGYRVHDPERYGVIEFDDSNNAVSLEEKPERPKSHYAATGLYFYDSYATSYARQLTPSARGELEITDLNKCYLDTGKLKVQLLQRGTAWLDTGTVESLMQAAQFVEAIQTRQGTVIACLEEIALASGWITPDAIALRVDRLGKGPYATYLRSLLIPGASYEI